MKDTVVAAAAFLVALALQGKAEPMPKNAAELFRTLQPTHPRLLADAARFDRIRGRVASDPLAKTWFDQLRKQADRIIDEPVVTYDIPDGKRLLSVSRRVADRVFTLGLVWQITGERKYLDRAWRDLQAAAAFKDWNPSHFLDTAEMTAALGIGYDWLYHGLADAQRRTIREALVTHGLRPGLAAYEGRARYGWWARGHNNWNQVCNGGMLAGALALADEDPDLAATIVRQAVESLPLAMREFGPDGGWAEGPGYWGYAMRYNVLAIACLESALGTDFGLSDIEGFDHAADFYLQMGGATRKCFNYADCGASPVQHPALFWLAAKFDRPGWAGYQARYGKLHATALLWYEPEPVAAAGSDLPTVARFRGVEVASARTAWDDDQALYLGFKAGRNGVSHGHLDLGSFIFEARGERWIVDLGSDDYNLPAYFGSKRFTYYRLRAEGHNTLVVNPGRTEPDQDPKAFCTITRAERDGDEAILGADLTPAYAGHGAKRVARTCALSDSALTVTDELALDGPGEAWWFFHTRAAVTVADDGRSAVLAIGDKRLTVRLEEPARARLTVMDARPLPGSPDPEGQNPNNGAKLANPARGHLVRVGETPRWGAPDPAKAFRKLAVHLRDVQSATVKVVFEPAM